MKHQPLAQVMRFIGVGGVASVLYFVAAAALNSLLGLPATVASVIAYAVGAVFAFFAHRRVTFGSDNAAGSEVPRFVAATAVGLALALIIPMLLSAYPPVVAFLAVLMVVPVYSFLMMKFFVFTA